MIGRGWLRLLQEGREIKAPPTYCICKWGRRRVSSREMPLDTGTRLGPYEILGPLGAGGMGEVYKAQDSRLDRTVAIKVLPAHRSGTAEVRARFEREAKAVSKLNHPHICTLHDVGREGDTDYIVMEHLEGETLAARLAQGPLPANEVTRVAIEIADALDAAHREGFVHRDLKPGNIMLTKSGAKLLDFGLARTTASDHSNTDLSQSPTVSQPLTAEGTIVGTFQYMAPEQLEGVEADARTDIFAFGAVLYEMVTGRTAFEGKSQASLIASILKEEPRAIAQLQPMTPPALDRVVARCLAKDPDQRWQTARDLMLELQWIRDGGSQVGVPAPVRSRRKSREMLAWALVAVFAAFAAIVSVPALFDSDEPDYVSRFAILLPEDLQISAAQVQTSISPDGRMATFFAADSTSRRSLYVRALDSHVARSLPGTGGGAQPFWSPDSRTIGFFTTGGKLARVSVADGTLQIICDAADGRGGAWGSKDIIVFSPASGGALFQVSAAGGPVTQVTELDAASGEEAHRWPQFLPDGEHFLYVSLPVRDGQFGTYIGSLSSVERQPTVKAAGGTIYAEPGHLLFERDQTLVAQPFDAATRQLSGTPMPIGEPPGQNGGWTGSPSVSASSNGVLLHTEPNPENSEIVWLDRKGHRTGVVPLARGLYGAVALSPDGDRLAVEKWGRGPTGFDSDIWTVELSRGVATRFTFHASENYIPKWSRDGRRIVWVSDRSGKENIYMKAIDSSDDDEPLLNESALFSKSEDFSPDGRFLVYHMLTKESAHDLWLLPLVGEDREPVPYLATQFNENDARVSPNGKWLAYRSDESGTFEVYVQSFPKAGSKYRVSINGAGGYGSQNYILGWVDGGTELVYVASDMSTVMAVDVETEPTFRAGKPRALFKTPRGRNGLTMTSDGQRFLMTVPTGGRSPALYVVTDWSASLEKP